jgi:raffinose/stachyose/melibiose transport system substrate-binding protein
MSWFRRSMALGAAAALVLSGCSGGGSESDQAGPKTIEWWHIQNTDPMRPVWDALAKQYHTQHPDITIKITALENEAYKAKLTTVTQSGGAPDIFHTWGGGVLQQQVQAGLVKDITGDIASWSDTLSPISKQPYQLDGKTYAVPFDIGMVGFWYNKALFKKAGIAAPPATWSEFLSDVQKLKTAGVTPIALAGKDKWPGHYYWSYLVMRVGGAQAFATANTERNFTGPDFVAAGQHLKELVDLDPFQKGFLGAAFDTPDGEAATMGNGNAAMELMGQWAPAVEREQSGKDLGDDLGFFPFPAVDGGKGSISDVFGGGGGFAVGKDAPPEAVDFLKFISQVDNQQKAVATGAVLPVTKGAESAVKDANLMLVQQALAKATGFQLYLDQAFAPAVGQEVNDSVAELIAGGKTPEQVTQAITTTAKTG